MLHGETWITDTLKREAISAFDSWDDIRIEMRGQRGNAVIHLSVDDARALADLIDQVTGKVRARQCD